MESGGMFLGLFGKKNPSSQRQGIQTKITTAFNIKTRFTLIYSNGKKYHGPTTGYQHF